MSEQAEFSSLEEGSQRVAPDNVAGISTSIFRSSVEESECASPKSEQENNQTDLFMEIRKYELDHPLVYSMMLHEAERTKSFKQEGRVQMNYPRSSDGWFASIFIIRGRALDHIIAPWAFVMLNAVLYTVIQESVLDRHQSLAAGWELFFGLALSGTLAFLLVFRLNRAATRYWFARELWGAIVAKGRTLMSGLVTHGDHNRHERDLAIRWVQVFVISAMEHLRGVEDISDYPVNHFAGILSKYQIKTELQDMNVGHVPLHAIDQIRKHLKLLFLPDNEAPAAVAYTRIRFLDSLETQLNDMMDSCGGMERIRGTPLPIVYVSHLRTFLILSLLLFPYIWGPSWQWMTIPIVALAAFAWLGIDAAAAEVESPFAKDRVNALDMDGFCLGFLSTVLQQIRTHADEEIRSKAQNECM